MPAIADHKVVVITGANKGLGYQAVKTLLGSDKKYHIFLGSRDFAKGQEAADTARKEVSSLSTVEPLQLDVESDESIQKAYETVESKCDRVDVLINNAGKSHLLHVITR
ncbi:Short-chain dehydrogenase/reductase tropE [Colletotrichum aenigma]|uniref:Short-chain dehydrogenase/reductase tropE n=1 Tax=Colletotrichum aenigma TaxID=1215731 RepID=UPI0018725D6E|nr:Short-chain dehydrogenase/reductase tropE [Colletotrichum aenigma]KAF5527610.1 Short-chain dehydrogenase/reductase tropE [Colletotrichum aenigma]